MQKKINSQWQGTIFFYRAVSYYTYVALTFHFDECSNVSPVMKIVSLFSHFFVEFTENVKIDLTGAIQMFTNTGT